MHPKPKTLELWDDGYIIYAWYYSIGDGERIPVDKSWLSNNNTVISLPPPETNLAGETIYVYAEVIPSTRRFSVEGFQTSENDPQAFVFRLVGVIGTQTEGIDVDFVVFDIGYLDISHLPYGKYTLTTLHWAWRVGDPTLVIFDGKEYIPKNGTVELDLNTVGDVTIIYPSVTNDKWLSDDASGIVPLEYSSYR